jgi:hypothetical protein
MQSGDTLQSNGKKRAIFEIDRIDRRYFIDRPNFGIDRSIYCHVTITISNFGQIDRPTENRPVY